MPCLVRVDGNELVHLTVSAFALGNGERLMSDILCLDGEQSGIV